MKKIKLGIVGCGAIGSDVALFVEKKLPAAMTVSALYDTDEIACADLKKQLRRSKPASVSSIDALVTSCDLVLEAASGAIVETVIRTAMRRKKDTIILSIGGLLGKQRLLRDVERSGIKVYLPSGAVAGIDAIQAAALGTITKCELTTSKPPEGLGVTGKKQARIRKPAIIFSGTPQEAYKLFPKNINVAGTLFLASRYPHIKVCIKIDPRISRNIHHIELESDIGRISIEVENVPSKRNPRTSAMAFASAEALLRKLTSAVRVGT